MLIVVYVWKNVDYVALIYLSGLQAVPQDLRDAAALADVPSDRRRHPPDAPTTTALVDLCRELGVVTCNPYGPLLARQPDRLAGWLAARDGTRADGGVNGVGGVLPRIVARASMTLRQPAQT